MKSSAGAVGERRREVQQAISPTNSDATVPIIRPSARVVVIDDADRVLLFAGTNDEDHRFWYPPGGAIELGESPEETARRELREETGLAVVNLQGEVGRRDVVVSWGGVRYDCRERWFVARVPISEVDTSGMADDEQLMISEYRWWSVDELAQTSDRLVPAILATLVRDLLEDGLPEQPIALGR